MTCSSPRFVVEAEFQAQHVLLPPQSPLFDATSLYLQGKAGTQYMMKPRILRLLPPKASVLPTNRVKHLNDFSKKKKLLSFLFLCHDQVNIPCWDYGNVFLTHLPAFSHHFL